MSVHGRSPRRRNWVGTDYVLLCGGRPIGGPEFVLFTRLNTYDCVVPRPLVPLRWLPTANSVGPARTVRLPSSHRVPLPRLGSLQVVRVVRGSPRSRGGGGVISSCGLLDGEGGVRAPQQVWVWSRQVGTAEGYSG